VASLRTLAPSANEDGIGGECPIATTVSAPSNPHRRQTAHRLPAGSFLGGFRTPAQYGWIGRDRPASETLHLLGHSASHSERLFLPRSGQSWHPRDLRFTGLRFSTEVPRFTWSRPD
jgi:hypothetical protein